MGMLTARADRDIMDPAVWAKSAEPVFKTSDRNKVFGPGGNTFTVDEHGRDVLVYHGRDYEKINDDPLFDPNRHTRVQRFSYRPDGSPDFGEPLPNGPLV
jgi:GH43 family beta-xylosidase